MQLLSLLSISFVSAIAAPGPLCSAAVKTLQVQSFPPAIGEEVKAQDFTKEEAAAMFDYQCSKDDTCSGLDSFPNITDIKERMSRNESSVEVFSWGYRIYIPTVVAEQAMANAENGCGLLVGIGGYCYGRLINQDYISVQFCAIFAIPPAFICVAIRDALIDAFSSVKIEDGAIVSSTWQTILKPTVKAASDYYLP